MLRQHSSKAKYRLRKGARPQVLMNRIQLVLGEGWMAGVTVGKQQDWVKEQRSTWPFTSGSSSVEMLPLSVWWEREQSIQRMMFSATALSPSEAKMSRTRNKHAQ